MIFRIMAVLMVAALFVPAMSAASDARIKCNGAYQIIRGQGEIATPYCEDNYLAQVARSYGIRVSNRTVRRKPHKAEEICHAIGHDSRVNAMCQKYRRETCGSWRC